MASASTPSAPSLPEYQSLTGEVDVGPRRSGLGTFFAFVASRYNFQSISKVFKYVPVIALVALLVFGTCGAFQNAKTLGFLLGLGCYLVCAIICCFYLGRNLLRGVKLGTALYASFWISGICGGLFLGPSFLCAYYYDGSCCFSLGCGLNYNGLHVGFWVGSLSYFILIAILAFIRFYGALFRCLFSKRYTFSGRFQVFLGLGVLHWWIPLFGLVFALAFFRIAFFADIFCIASALIFIFATASVAVYLFHTRHRGEVIAEMLGVSDKTVFGFALVDFPIAVVILPLCHSISISALISHFFPAIPSGFGYGVLECYLFMLFLLILGLVLMKIRKCQSEYATFVAEQERTNPKKKSKSKPNSNDYI